MQDEKVIRIAQIMGKLWAGGVENVVFNYYRQTDKTRIQFDFYYDSDSTVEPPQELIDMGARFIEIPPYQKLPRYLKTLRNHFKENRYTIVHSHINTLSVFPLFAAWCEKVPVRIAHNHSVPGGKEFRRNALKYFLKLFAKVFATDYYACSEKAGRWLFGDKEFEKGNVFVVKNALEFEKFRHEKTELRKKYGLENCFVIGHVGRFTYAKNHKFLLNVFESIVGKIPDAKLVLIGDGELHDEIINIINEKQLTDKVVLVGQVTDPWEYYCLADVVVMPSIFEGLPLTTVESQIAGVPVVVSEAIPAEAVVSNGCFHMNLSDSPEAWADKIIAVSGTEVILNEYSEEYNIYNAVKKLENKYLSYYK